MKQPDYKLGLLAGNEWIPDPNEPLVDIARRLARSRKALRCIRGKLYVVHIPRKQQCN